MNTTSSVNILPKLYSLKGLVLAALLGSMISGTVLVYLNYAALDRKRSGIQISAVIFVLWIVIGGVFSFVPEFPGDTIILIAVQGFVMLEIGNRLFGTTYNKFEEDGGNYHSLWRCAGIAILVPVIMVAVFILVSLQLNWLPN